jgi:hypothetical protein
MREQSMITTN